MDFYSLPRSNQMDIEILSQPDIRNEPKITLENISLHFSPYSSETHSHISMKQSVSKVSSKLFSKINLTPNNPGQNNSQSNTQNNIIACLSLTRIINVTNVFNVSEKTAWM